MSNEVKNTFVFPLDQVPSDRKALIGGKALSLSRMMTELKVNVPGGYAISCEAFSGGAIRDEAKAEIDSLVASLDEELTYAVRSSAINEDGAKASFAGQYETVTDVPKAGIMDAIGKVIASVGSATVKEYEGSFSQEDLGIGVVIQKFVKPEFAGVVFTSDPITGADDQLVGSYVHGEGEQLVSGNANAKEFHIGAIKYSYEGPSEFVKYSKKLGKYCLAIRRNYGVPMDIEWAVSNRKVYILQARPITTLQRIDTATYEVNGSKSNKQLLTRTNVGEIFMKPVSPMTFSVLEKINEMLGIPDWLNNIYGQEYMNVSVIASALVAYGKTVDEAYDLTKELTGYIPEGVVKPISPFDKKAFRKTVWRLIFPKEKSKLSRKEKHQMVKDLSELCDQHIEKIKTIETSKELGAYWDDVLQPALNDGLASIMTESGMQLVPLFGTRKKLAKVSDDEMANRLLGGCIGVVESMKPMLLLEDVLAGKMSKEEYVKICGHRAINEMELMEPHPYEDPSFPDNAIEELRESGTNLHAMLKAQEEAFSEALSEFKSSYPSKAKWVDKKIEKYRNANAFREEIRSKGVRIFCVFREYIRRAGALNDIGDDIFFLMYKEMFALLKGDRSVIKLIPERKKTYERYLTYPPFPNLIIGRFDPDEWIKDPNRRTDYFVADLDRSAEEGESDVKGFPGAAGVVTGKAKVILSIDDIDKIEKGDILVTTATNIGWTLAFPKVSAIVTDIGAPLSHAAIVAREFGIPAVVGCGNATTVLKTGDLITVDGAHGKVTVIKE
ncbi:MAG: phosphoenolpyruvate synthase [Clostridiales bacterium]|nr:phosphoenolpyruvate synthase [Clostridiales bacterium]